jgi:hypothetical protein
MGSLLTHIVLNVDQLVLQYCVYALDTVCEFDLFLSSLSPFTADTVFKPLSILSGGDSLFILYSNRITNAYTHNTYSTAYSNSNIYSIYSID